MQTYVAKTESQSQKQNLNKMKLENEYIPINTQQGGEAARYAKEGNSRVDRFTSHERMNGRTWEVK